VTLLAALVLLLNLAVFGLHAVVPTRVARGEMVPPRAWAIGAPACLALSLVATLAAVGRAPDQAAAWGLADPLRLSPVTGLLAIPLLALFLSDLVVALGWRKLEPASWWPAAVLGWLAVGAHAFGSELLHAGWGPVAADRPTLFAIVLLRVPAAWSAGELVLGAPRLGTLVAGPAILAASALWPRELRAGLGASAITLVAGSLLLLAARWLPRRLRRGAAALGLGLVALFLAHSGEISRILGAHETLPADLLEP